MSVLIVEDGQDLRRLLRNRLRDQGVDVTMAGSVSEAIGALDRRHYRVVIIDLRLPDGNGLQVLDAVRGAPSDTHVIVMSESTAEDDRVTSMERGADDYVVKPFLLRELTARILAVRRRASRTDSLLQLDRVSIDLETRVAAVDGRIVELTAKEFDLLAYLTARPGHSFGKEQLLRVVWGSDAETGDPRVVARSIRRLRAKIETDPAHPRILRSVRGTGYRMQAGAVSPRGRSSPHQELGRGTVVHVDGRIVRADRAARIMLGVAAHDDLLGRQIVELVTAASRDAAVERMASNGISPPRRSQLVDLERDDGTEVSVEVASVLTKFRGVVAERITFTHVPDVSARLRRLVTGVLSDLTDAVIITDLHFHLRSWNKAAERLYGWREAEVIGRHVLDVIQWVGDEGALATTWENLEVKGRWKGHSRQVARDGSVIDVLASTTLLRDDTGDPVLIVSVNRLGSRGVGRSGSADAFDVDDIRAGIARDEFEVHYQPVVALDGLEILTMEALVRWNHPERGLLAPAAFMDPAECSGAIVELGDAVLEQACIQMTQWRQDGYDLDLAVNISARQLSDPGLVDRITGILAYSGLAAEKLWLEVTETALVEEIDRASEVLYRLSELGVGISIDDFGTGWASLTYLRSFPVHVLKIDRSFVAGVGRNANDTAIVRSILSLGAELGLFVVAEGIETTGQEQSLKKLGCMFGQGYLYGRPTPASTTPLEHARRSAPESSVRARARPPVAPAPRRAPERPSVVPIRRLSAAEVVAQQEPGCAEPGGMAEDLWRTLEDQLPTISDDAQDTVDALRRLSEPQ